MKNSDAKLKAKAVKPVKKTKAKITAKTTAAKIKVTPGKVSRKAAKAEVDRVWATVEAASNDHINPDDYTGIFEDSWFGKIRISLQGNQLWFSSLRSPALMGPMHYYKANAFVIK